MKGAARKAPSRSAIASPITDSEAWRSDIHAEPTNFTELSWLSEVGESRQPLSEIFPIWVRYGTITSGPPVPYPEKHPFCELGTTLRGVVESYVEREHATRMAGDLFLAGPGVPHWAKIVKYPLEFMTVYFLPSVLIELGPEHDGARIISRFTANQSLSSRLVRTPVELRNSILRRLKEMRIEFEADRFGREIRLRVLLASILVDLIRWEESVGKVSSEHGEFDWAPVNKALHYLREHYSEPIYAKNLARAAGISESTMKVLFQRALGISWVKYLQGYRIHRAAANLGLPGASITETALNVGFDSISHFNSTFRSFMGVSPSEYQARERTSLFSEGHTGRLGAKRAQNESFSCVEK
jgi:AraC-like DNA-binding protein